MILPIKFSKEGPNGWLAAQNKPLETAKLISGKAVGLDHIYSVSYTHLTLPTIYSV